MPTMMREVDTVCVVCGGGSVESVVVGMSDCFPSRLSVVCAVRVAGCGRKGVSTMTCVANVSVCSAAVMEFVVCDTAVKRAVCVGEFATVETVDRFSGG